MMWQPMTPLPWNKAVLLVVALVLLVAGFPFLVFGSFLAAIDAEGAIDGGGYFAVGGLIAILGAVGIRAYLRRLGEWF